MAAAGEWELVTKTKGKPSTVANGKLNKTEKQQFLDSAPKLTYLGTIDTSGIGKENRQPKSPKANGDSRKKKVEKKKEPITQPPRTLEEAMTKLSVNEMQNLLDVVVSRFIDSPLIWLKDLASYLNVRLNPVTSPDPAFRGSPPGFPTCLLQPPVKKLIIETLSGCSDSVLTAFHQHCITSMVHEQTRGLSVAGYKLFIQILSIHRPEVCVAHLGNYCELRQQYQNQAGPCLSLLWAIGQAGLDNFSIGLKIWLELMVPLIGLKNYWLFVVEYGSTIFSGGGGGSNDPGVVLGVREFFTILDFTWLQSSTLPKQVQRQLFALYPKVKTVAFTSKPETTLHNFFPSFLRRLDPTVPDPYKVELLTCLVQCLMQDPACWSIWGQLYLKHLPQSAMLLQHLEKEWPSLESALRKRGKDAQKTVEGFIETNQQMAHKVSVVAGLKEGTEAAKSLILQMKRSRSRYPLSRFVKLLMLLSFIVLVWDIRKAGSFKESRVGQTLERFGLMVYVEEFLQAFIRISLHSYKWCVINLPVYYSHSCELAGPYLILMLEKVTSAAATCWATLESAALYIPIIKDKVEAAIPGLSETIGGYLNVIWEFLQMHWLSVMKQLEPYFSQLHEYIVTKILIGPLAPEKLHEYVLTAVNSTTALLLRVHSGLINALEDLPNTGEGKQES
ncbi:unnamed protein product [Meganyctiphanes norvegica]|uniref:Transmembrane protein 214 n=1 Tax=Meganyctiphanes norvegica TaxID=48144 RepID=A0AAV2QX86_MEGNR